MTVPIFGATHSLPTENTGLARSSHANIRSKIIPAVAAPYIHPLVHRSTIWMSEESLEMCTESLGSETGTNDFDDGGWFTTSTAYMPNEKTGQQEGICEMMNVRRELLSSVNNHCIGRRSSPRYFPPPLPSISSREGPCIQMRPHRLDGRLVVTANRVPPKNYLQARRNEDRLVLSFIDSTSYHTSCSTDTVSTETHTQPKYSNYENQIKEAKYVNFGDQVGEQIQDEEEEEEVVEVLDNRNVVEVKVRTQPQQQRGSIKVVQSSIVINKFGGGAPLRNESGSPEPPNLLSKRQMVPTTTSAGLAAVAGSSVSTTVEIAQLNLLVTENKLLFKWNKRNREEML